MVIWDLVYTAKLTSKHDNIASTVAGERHDGVFQSFKVTFVNVCTLCTTHGHLALHTGSGVLIVCTYAHA